jgi:hypothetical protein
MIGSNRSTIGNRGNSARRCRADGGSERSRETAAWYRRSRRRVYRRPFDNLGLPCFVRPAGPGFAPAADRSCAGERSSPAVADHDGQTGCAPSRPHSPGHWPHRRRNVGEAGPRAFAGAGIVNRDVARQVRPSIPSPATDRPTRSNRRLRSRLFTILNEFLGVSESLFCRGSAPPCSDFDRSRPA